MRWFWLVIAVGGCGPGVPGAVVLTSDEGVLEVARSLCAKMFACDCGEYRAYESQAECELAVVSSLSFAGGTDSEGESSAYAYDPTCYERFVVELDALGCGAAPPTTCTPPCRAYTGRLAVGDDCSQDSECQQGLVCYGVCVDPCRLAREGENCEVYPCGDDLRCDGIVCRALPSVGESCALFSDCASPAWCERVDPNDSNSFACAAPVADDELCSGHAQCQSGYCPAGRCRPMPTLGEPCPGSSPCAAGLDCSGEVCVRARPFVCDGSLPG